MLAALYFLFVFGLTDAGLIGPDEPRYASIGREMARSGDWVTPHLWGQPWFEKPPLLYWMIAAANMLGLGEELAPRLPVVLASIVFLLFYYFLLRAEFGARAALFAAAMLGTSAAWVAFSQVAVTDLPMTVAFSSAMLLGLRWLSSGDRRWLLGVAFLLGLAVLAKGLVPLVLFLPLLWAGRRRLKDWLWPLPWAVFLATVTPWYVLCYWRNGDAFLQEFFWRHHFARFTSGETLHPQPFWFYVPVLLAGLFPWIPLALPLFRKSLYADPRRRFLLVWAVFGLVFFSASAGKLPGYLLPLFPAVTALAALALDEIKNARWLLVACCLLLLLIPTISATLPRRAHGRPQPQPRNRLALGLRGRHLPGCRRCELAGENRQAPGRHAHPLGAGCLQRGLRQGQDPAAPRRFGLRAASLAEGLQGIGRSLRRQHRS